MAEYVTLKLEGAESLRQVLDQLGPRIEKNITTAAMRKAALVLVPEIERRAMALERTKKRKGDLVASIGFRVKTYRKTGLVYVAVGPLWPRGAHGWNVEHGHRMVVGGSIVRTTGKRAGKTPTAYSLKYGDRTGRGRVVNQVPGYPFVAPAFAAKAHELVSTITEYHAARVEREAAKLAKGTFPKL